MKTLSFLCLLAACTLSGCDLKFGDDVEVSGAAFNSAKLAEITTLTGITFPPGTRGLDYYYQGSGIDDALSAKVAIPDAGIPEFNTNPVMTTGTDSKADMQIGRGKTWWKIDGLTERIDRKMELQNQRFLEVTCGREGNDFVVYVSWCTT